MERIADHLDLEHLKKISGVCVSDPDRIILAEPADEERLSQSFSEVNSSPSELGESAVMSHCHVFVLTPLSLGETRRDVRL